MDRNIIGHIPDLSFEGDDEYQERERDQRLQDGDDLPTNRLHVSATSTEMDTLRFVHRWVVKQFPVYQELYNTGDFLESNCFGSSDGNYKFRLKLFPKGKDDDCHSFLSLYLTIRNCPTNRIKFKVNFYVETTEGTKACSLNRNMVTIHKGGIVTASKFYALEEIRDKPSLFLPDEALTICAELLVFKDPTSRRVGMDQLGEAFADDLVDADNIDFPMRFDSISYPVNFPTPLSTKLKLLGSQEETDVRLSMTQTILQDKLDVCKDVGKLFMNDELTDFTIICNGVSFRVHKAILSARCTYFATMFSDETNMECKSGEVTFEDFDNEIMKAVLRFIYTGEVLEESKSIEMLGAADRLQLDSLKTFIEKCLVSEVNQSTVCNLLLHADIYNAERLRKRCINCIGRYQSKILQSEDWDEIEKKNPTLASQTLKAVVMRNHRTQATVRAAPMENNVIQNKRPRFS
ncbi:Speckle-type POZ protein [Strongyloides ratti]|uniref:Speckle-type POZ protein n=1 Tax=Strongyloides ratti TaxID=34506 RepID=A0A090LAT4_STRRB|nr:Speckle-type POZ protein [Strongyloides ratti]CEF65203.1 Speckle-type POZ protein [Strongyloides ratti]